MSEEKKNQSPLEAYNPVTVNPKIQQELRDGDKHEKLTQVDPPSHRGIGQVYEGRDQ